LIIKPKETNVMETTDKNKQTLSMQRLDFTMMYILLSTDLS
jgi:hypothetical protein